MLLFCYYIVMKNKKIIYFIIVSIVIIALTIVSIFKYVSLSINSLSNTKWYRYNYANGLYDSLEFTNGSINYFKPTSTNNVNSLDNCTKYSYDKKNKIIKLDCNKEIKIDSYDNNSLTLELDGKNTKFFTNIEDSLNYEFESYFEKSIVDYKKERNQVTEFSKINKNKLIEVLRADEYSKIVFIGNKCTSVDCALILDIMEKWVSTNENIYFYDIKDLDLSIINYLNNISLNKFDYNYFNDIYPKVLVVKNNSIIDRYEVNCTGFNCTKYYKNEF